MDPTAQGLTGYTTTVITPWGRETYQVWLERTACAWVARIVTLPNRIWAQAGGREAIKFHGATREDAEAEAVRFIEEERILKKRRVWLPRVDERADRPGVAGAAVAGAAVAGAAVAAAAVAAVEPAVRVPHRLLLRFGVEVPKLPGLTANLSKTGLFIITDRPGPVGSEVRIDLRFPDRPLLLGGKVMWVRQRREEGSLGFGVKLIETPEEYERRINGL